MAIVGYALAALVGLSLGLMGGGGSIMTVPIFVYVLGYDPKLAIVMLTATIVMFRSAGRPSAATDSADASVAQIRLGLLVPVALTVGVITGLVGIGGGFLVVPALVILAHAPMKQAVGSSLLVIAMNSTSAFAGYLGHVQFPWAFMLSFTAVAVGGIVAGTALVRHVSQRALKRSFAVFLIAMGSFMLYRNRAVFLPPHATVRSACNTLEGDTAWRIVT